MTELAGEDREHGRLRVSLTAAAELVGLDASSGKRRTHLASGARITAVFKAIAHINDAGLRRTSLWRMCSAWAHNDDTMVANLSPRSDGAAKIPGSFHVRVEPMEEWIDMCAMGLGLDLSRLLVLAREFGAVWPDHEQDVTQAINLFPNTEVRERLERRLAQLQRGRQARRARPQA